MVALSNSSWARAIKILDMNLNRIILNLCIVKIEGLAVYYYFVTLNICLIKVLFRPQCRFFSHDHHIKKFSALYACGEYVTKGAGYILLSVCILLSICDSGARMT